MPALLAPTTKNAVQKTLAAQLLSTAGVGDPISFDDVDGIPNLPGVLVINRINSNGDDTPANREYIEYSGTSGSTVLITTRNVDGSNAALTHAVGSIVEFIPDAIWADRMYDALSTRLIDPDDLTLRLSDGTTTVTSILDEDDMSSDSATALATQQSIKAYVDANAGAGGKYVFIIPGTAVTGTDVAGTWFAPEALTIDSVDLYLDTAGATGSMIVDLNIDGTTAFSTQGNRPTLADTATVDTGNVPDVTSVTANQKITVDIDQITTTPGVDTYVVVKYS